MTKNKPTNWFFRTMYNQIKKINGIKPQSKTLDSFFPMQSIGELNHCLRVHRSEREGGLNKIQHFQLFCLESYRNSKDVTGMTALNDFKRARVFDFLSSDYEVLHSMGRNYLNSLITDYIKRRKWSFISNIYSIRSGYFNKTRNHCQVKGSSPIRPGFVSQLQSTWTSEIYRCIPCN